MSNSNFRLKGRVDLSVVQVNEGPAHASLSIRTQITIIKYTEIKKYKNTQSITGSIRATVCLPAYQPV